MYYALIVLATFLFSVQFVFNDLYQRAEGATVVKAMLFSGINALVGGAMLMLTSPDAFQFTAFSFMMAALTAVNNVLAAYVSIMVLSRANLSVYSLYSMLGGMLLPFGYAILFQNEPVTWQKGVCAVLIVAALIMGVKGKEKKAEEAQGSRFVWLWYMGIFVMNGLSGVFSTMHQRAGELAASASAYTLLSKGWSVALCLIVLLVCALRRQKIALSRPLRSVGSSAGYGVITTFANLILLIALLHVDASVQYPIVTGGVIVLSLMWDWILGKRPNRFAVCAAGVSFLGLMFLAV